MRTRALPAHAFRVANGRGLARPAWSAIVAQEVLPAASFFRSAVGLIGVQFRRRHSWMASCNRIKIHVRSLPEDSAAIRSSWRHAATVASAANVRDGLGHRSVAVTQIYLPTSSDRMEACMRETDWTLRNPRRAKLPAKPGHFGGRRGEGHMH